MIASCNIAPCWYKMLDSAIIASLKVSVCLNATISIHMSSLGDRLREERRKLGLSQTAFAELAGQKKQSQVNYEADKRHPDSKYLSAIANAGADILYIVSGVRSLLGSPLHLAQQIQKQYGPILELGELAKQMEAENLEIDGHNFSAIPRFDAQLAAGDGLLNDDQEPIEYLAFSHEWLLRKEITPGRACLLSVKGSSMEPTLYCGDLVMVDKRKREIRNKRMYAFRDVDGGARIKRLEVLPGVAIVVHSDNIEVETQFRSGDDMNTVAEGIIGEVVWSGHSWN